MICKDNRAVARSCFFSPLRFISLAILVFLRLHSVPLRHIMLFGSIGWCRHLRETAGLLESVRWSAAAAVWSGKKLVCRRRAVVSGRRWVVWESLLQRGIPHNSLGFSHYYSKDHSVFHWCLPLIFYYSFHFIHISSSIWFVYVSALSLCSCVSIWLHWNVCVCVDIVVWGNVSEATN